MDADVTPDPRPDSLRPACDRPAVPERPSTPERWATLDQWSKLVQQMGEPGRPGEAGLDRLTRVAARCLGVPVVLATLVDGDRQFYCSGVGVDVAGPADRQSPLSRTPCKRVVDSGGPVVVVDARTDPVLRDLPIVTDAGAVAYAGFPLATEGGQVLGTFCAIDRQPRQWSASDLQILRDLAGAVMSELTLKLAVATAESANRAKDRFLAILSHELRTPLSPVLLLAAAIAEDGSLPESVRADARTIGRNVRQQTRLVDDLLDVTRVENGKVSLARAAFDLHPLLGEVIADSRADADAKRITLTGDCRAARHHVDGDVDRLRQVFANLVRNAVKFTPAGGRVVVSTGDEAMAVRVTVADTGIGVEPAVLPKLFDPFEQGSKAITDEFSGLGLGLAIAKGLVDAHGGGIVADSDGRGRGTTFTVTLPTVAAPALAAAARPGGGAPDAQAGGVDILLVEDHKDTLAAMTRLLRRLGHRVTGAGSVADAVAAADGGRFDLLISDVDLPDGTGLDLMRQLAAARRDGRPLPGIALTGYGMESDVRSSEAAGFFAHLVKPINFAHLEDAIRRAATVGG